MSSRQAMNNIQQVEKIILFTITIDSHDPVLAQTIDWIKGFAGIFVEVNVFALHLGDLNGVPKNVRFFKFGGGNFWLKSVGILKTYRQMTKLLRQNNSIVFYHMVTWPIVFFGPLAKLLKHKQGVWYSHNHADIPLRITQPLVNKYFSPTVNCFPLRDKSKLVTNGHYIDFEDFPDCQAKHLDWNLNEIACIGRIAPVKRIELLFEALNQLSSRLKSGISVKLIGYVQDQQYWEFLQNRAQIYGINLILSQPLVRSELVPALKNINFIFNATPNSVDKSALEACATGAIPITENEDLIKLAGADIFWKNSKFAGAPSVYEQIKYLMSTNRQELIGFSLLVEQSTRSQNDVKSKVNSIRNELS